VSDINLKKVWKDMPLRLVAYMIKVDKKDTNGHSHAHDDGSSDYETKKEADVKEFDPKIPHSAENKVLSPLRLCVHHPIIRCLSFFCLCYRNISFVLR
jgi:hypothetical protein